MIGVVFYVYTVDITLGNERAETNDLEHVFLFPCRF